MSVLFIIVFMLTFSVGLYFVGRGIASLIKGGKEYGIKMMKMFGIVVSVSLVFLVLAIASKDTGGVNPKTQSVANGYNKNETVGNAEKEASENLALTVLEDGFKGIADVHFVREEKTFIVTPQGSKFELEIVMMMSGNKSLESWNGMVDSVASLSSIIKSSLGDGYLIMVANPANTDKFLLSAMDGVIIYDVFDE